MQIIYIMIAMNCAGMKWSVCSLFLKCIFFVAIRDATTQNGKRDKNVPDLPPPLDDVLGFSYIRNVDVRRYIKSLFIGAVYEPGCDNTNEIIVQPVYFWPGEQVSLRCVVCRKAFGYNGLVKQWWFMSMDNVESELKKIDKIHLSNRWYKSLERYRERYFNDANRKYGYMLGGANSAVRSRPITRFIQRNGALTILHPTIDNSGLYRCLDETTIHTGNIIFYLISMQPLYAHSDWRGVTQLERECGGANPIPDMNWKFRHIPPTILRNAGLCADDNLTRDKFKCINWLLSDYNIVENRTWNLFQNDRDAEIAKRFVNLRIQLQWNEWSSCAQGETVRTREGHCYLGKINPHNPVGNLLHPFFRTTDVFNWVLSLQNHFEMIKEFNTTGIRLHSGLIAKMIGIGSKLEGEQRFDYCYKGDKNPGYSSSYNRWKESILSAFNPGRFINEKSIGERICFYHFTREHEVVPDGVPENLMIGTHILDTQPCS